MQQETRMRSKLDVLTHEDGVSQERSVSGE